MRGKEEQCLMEEWRDKLARLDLYVLAETGDDHFVTEHVTDDMWRSAIEKVRWGISARELGELEMSMPRFIHTAEYVQDRTRVPGSNLISPACTASILETENWRNQD